MPARIFPLSAGWRKNRTDEMENKEHNKKMVAPIIITIVFLAYLLIYGILVVKAAEWSPALILFAIPLIALGIGMVYVLITRIREIRSGEEDDLSNY